MYCQGGPSLSRMTYTDEEDRDSLGSLLPRVPSRERVQGSWDVARLGQAEEQAGDEEASIIGLEGLESADEAD